MLVPDDPHVEVGRIEVRIVGYKGSDPLGLVQVGSDGLGGNSDIVLRGGGGKKRVGKCQGREGGVGQVRFVRIRS